MNPSGSCWLIKFEPVETMDEVVSDFMDDYFDVVAINYTEDGREEYVGYKDNHFDEQDFIKAAEQWHVTLPRYQKEFLTSQNWLTENIIKFAPVKVGDFTIYGIHEQNIPNDGRLNLRIYAATAFGSEHQTTRSCLQALSDYHKIKKVSEVNVLDMGTGSGILALAAAKLWQKKCHITAVDIDEEAVSVTQQNAIDNQLQQYIDVAVSDGYQSDLVKKNAPYDLVFANILARPLISMAPDLYQNLKIGGYCILSGFVEDQENWVINEHIKQGLVLRHLYQLDNWRAALMEKIS